MKRFIPMSPLSDSEVLELYSLVIHLLRCKSGYSYIEGDDPLETKRLRLKKILCSDEESLLRVVEILSMHLGIDEDVTNKSPEQAYVSLFILNQLDTITKKLNKLSKNDKTLSEDVKQLQNRLNALDLKANGSKQKVDPKDVESVYNDLKSKGIKITGGVLAEELSKRFNVEISSATARNYINKIKGVV